MPSPSPSPRVRPRTCMASRAGRHCAGAVGRAHSVAPSKFVSAAWACSACIAAAKASSASSVGATCLSRLDTSMSALRRTADATAPARADGSLISQKDTRMVLQTAAESKAAVCGWQPKAVPCTSQGAAGAPRRVQLRARARASAAGQRRATGECGRGCAQQRASAPGALMGGPKPRPWPCVLALRLLLCRGERSGKASGRARRQRGRRCGWQGLRQGMARRPRLLAGRRAEVHVFYDARLGWRPSHAFASQHMPRESRCRAAKLASNLERYKSECMASLGRC